MKTKLLISLFIYFYSPCIAQNRLPDYINLARSNSLQSKSVTNTLEREKVNYQIFRSQYKPSLLLTGNLPSYNKDNFEVRQPDGSLKFLNRSQNLGDATISFTQPIAFSGGTLSLNTGLRRFDDFVAKTKQYNGTPVFIQLSQPLFSFNPYIWDKKIEPLKLQEATLTAQQQLLQLDLDICRAYFDILESQTNYQLSKTSLQFCHTNLAIEKRRVQLGVSMEDKTLQLEILELNSQRQMEADSLLILKNFIYLRNLVNSTDTTLPLLQPPVANEQFMEDAAHSLSSGSPLLNSIIARRKLLEAQRNTARIRAENNQVNLSASYGLTNAANTIPGIYQSPNDQQRFSIGFSVPLTTWGKRKHSLAASRLQEKQVELSNKEEENKIITELKGILIQLPQLKQNIVRSQKIDSLTDKRLEITNRLYQSGKATLLELQNALTEKENAGRKYISELRAFWEAFYLLRVKATLSL